MEKLHYKIIVVLLVLSGTSCSHKRTVDDSNKLTYSQPSDWQTLSSDADLLRLAVLDEPTDSTAATDPSRGGPTLNRAKRVVATEVLPVPAPEAAVSPVVDASILPSEQQGVRRTWLWGSLLVIAAILLGAKWARDRNRANPSA